MPKYTEMQIEKMPKHGYIVRERMGPPIYASSDIDDALGFIKDQLGEPEQPPSTETLQWTEAERAEAFAKHLPPLEANRFEINEHGDVFK